MNNNFKLSLYHLALSAFSFALASLVDSDTLRFQGLGFMIFSAIIWHKSQDQF